jgi:hypothetical protein
MAKRTMYRPRVARKRLRCQRCKRRQPATAFDLVYGPGLLVMYDSCCRACGGSKQRRVPRATSKRCAHCGEPIASDRSYLWTEAGFIHQKC